MDDTRADLYRMHDAAAGSMHATQMGNVCCGIVSGYRAGPCTAGQPTFFACHIVAAALAYHFSESRTVRITCRCTTTIKHGSTHEAMQPLFGVCRLAKQMLVAGDKEALPALTNTASWVLQSGDGSWYIARILPAFYHQGSPAWPLSGRHGHLCVWVEFHELLVE